MARPTSPTLLPDASGLHLVRLEADEQFILAVVETTSPEALCPLCQCRSQSMHSRYVRIVADLLMARVGRYDSNCMCDAFSARTRNVCARSSTFRLPHVVAPSARRTTRLTDLFTLIGFADRVGKQASTWWMEWG